MATRQSMLLDPAPPKPKRTPAKALKPPEPAQDVPAIAPSLSEPWRCTNALALSCDGRWWLSAHAVVNCLCCRPPAWPSLAIATGDRTTTPLVLVGRTSTLAQPLRGASL